MRQIEMSVEAIAIGEISKDLEQMELGTRAMFEGFLTQKTLRNERLIFHITKIE
jgi:primosomal replication protein N